MFKILILRYVELAFVFLNVVVIVNHSEVVFVNVEDEYCFISLRIDGCLLMSLRVSGS